MNTHEIAADNASDRPVEAYDLVTVSDADLLDAWQRDQSRDALATLVHRYAVMVLSVCRRRCRSGSDAEDAFQTTFLYMARHCHKIRQPERLPGWLHRVAQRASIATFPTRQREVPLISEVPADPDDPLEKLARRHEAIVLDEELADLPDHYRAALVMHILEGHSLARLAEQFGTTVGAIRGQLQRGKKLLAQRLRRRGVVPVIAFASAATCSVSLASAATVSNSFIQSIDSAQLPVSPIAPSCLEPLLNEGFQLMKMPFVSSVAAVGSLLVGLIVFGSLGAKAIPADDGPVVLFQGLVEPSGTGQPSVVAINAGSIAGKASDGSAGMEQASVPPPATSTSSNMVWQEKIVQPTLDSQASMDASAALQNSYALEGTVTLHDLPAMLSEVTNAAVWLDQRAIEFATVDGSESTEFSGNEELLATSLHRYLNPLGLKATVQNEGLVITADHLALARKGIGASQWVNIDEQAERSIASALKKTVSTSFVEETLQSAIEMLSGQGNIPIMIDAKALEETGLAVDVPVTLTINDVKLGTALEAMLSPLDLTYTVKREILHVTTRDAREQTPLIRLYWLDGTGFPQGNFNQVIESIQTTIAEDMWAANGGFSKMSPLPSGTRSGLLVSTTYTVHQEIEALLSKLREINFGVDPVVERVQVPRVQSDMGLGGGGIGGGGGGGFGGGDSGGFF